MGVPGLDCCIAEKLGRPSSSSAQTSPSTTQSGVFSALTSLRDVLEALGVVLVLARAQLGLAAGDARDDAVAVPLDLELPAVDPRHLLRIGKRRQHRLVPERWTGRASWGAVVALAEDQPVLLVAAEVRRH